MTPRQAAADRRVINAAKRIERAAQYGINSVDALHEYDQARAEQHAARAAQGARA